MTDSHDPTYASNDPVDHESEYGAPETRSGTAARPERVSIAGNEFSWPVPDRTIRVGGRAISVEIAVVAAIYAFAGLWLLWQTKSLFSYLPDSLAGLFSSNAFEFAFTWIIFLVIAVLLYVVVGLLYIAYSLYRADPIGRGLSAVLFATLLLLCFTSARSGVLTTITLVSGVCSAALFLSPWARQVFAESPRRGTDRPRWSSPRQWPSPTSR
jgi:hypothetical protein